MSFLRCRPCVLTFRRPADTNCTEHGPPLAPCTGATKHRSSSFHFLPAGTHVTGIVGALANQYGFSGAAPAATLGHYRVFGCTGETANDLILAALERAYSVDHVDIVSLSLGGAVGWLDDTAVQIYQNFLATVGVQVVAAAGNDRSEGPFFSESPAAGLLTNAVASVYVLATNGCCGWRMAVLTPSVSQ